MNTATALKALAVAVLVLFGCEAANDGAAEAGLALKSAGLGGVQGADALEQESSPIVLRRVWGDVPDGVGASISSDGRFLTFIDWINANLMIRELATGNTEAVTYDGSWDPQEFPMEARISPEGDQVAYVWFSQSASLMFELRVIELGAREPRLLYRSPECTYLSPVSWLPSGNEILFACSWTDNATRLMKVPTGGGSASLIKTFAESSGPDNFGGGCVSPSGRYLVYNFFEDDESRDNDISILDLETSATTSFIRTPGDEYVLGWSPDGDYILFASDRTGALGAWLHRVEDGKPVGDPWLVKADLWRMSPLGFTEDGAFYYGVDLGSRKLYTASVDLETGAVLSHPTGVTDDLITMETEPDWSPNGQFLAYEIYPNGRTGGRNAELLVVRDVRTGEEQVIELNLQPLGELRWYPDNRHLLMTGRNEEDETVWFRLDVDTGQVDLLPALHGLEFGTGNFIDWAPDMVHFYYSSPDGVHVVNTETGNRSTLYSGEIGLFPGLSSDGRYIAFAGGDHLVANKGLWVIPTTDGEPRPLVVFEEEDSIHWGGQEWGGHVWGIAWSQDDESIIYTRDGELGAGLWKIPATGGSPERIELAVPGRDRFPGTRDIRLHPDGRRMVLSVMGGLGGEVWVMENFLPEEGGENGGG